MSTREEQAANQVDSKDMPLASGGVVTGEATYRIGDYNAFRRAPCAPEGQNPHEKGVKLDFDKPPVWRGFFQYFPRAILRVSQVSLFGANKYIWGGWSDVEDGYNRYSDANLRHLCYEAMGEVLDPESEIEHAAHAAWGAMARLEKLLTERDLT